MGTSNNSFTAKSAAVAPILRCPFSRYFLNIAQKIASAGIWVMVICISSFGSSAQTLQECQSDWNVLLLKMQSQDSTCKAFADSMQSQLEQESRKSMNYQSSWQEMVGELRKCNIKVDDCKDQLASEAQPASEQPATPMASVEKRSYWWAWLMAGAIIGGLGMGLSN